MSKNQNLGLPLRKKLRVESVPESTPLHNAVKVGKLNMVKKLLMSRADINRKIKNGYTPLNIAVRKRKLDCFHLLLDRGANVNIIDMHGKIPLYYAAEFGELLMLKRLLSLESPVNAQDWNKKSPLHLATEHKHFGCVRELLKAGASIDIRDNKGKTPLQIAISKGCSGAVKQLLTLNGDIIVHGLNGGNIAIERGNLESCLTLLLNAGVDGDLIRTIIFNSLHIAVLKGNRNFWKKLLDRKLVDFTDKSRLFKLYETVLLRNKLNYFDDLIEAGVDVHVKGKKNTTLLHLASKLKSELPLAKLLKFKPDVNARDDNGNTPLHLACCNQKLKHTILLLDAEARWDIPNIQKRTMLWELLHSIMFFKISDEQIPLLKVILERTNHAQAIDFSTKYTAAHFILNRIFFEQIDWSFELIKLVLSTQKTLDAVDGKGYSIVNHITHKLKHIGINCVPFIQMCIECGAHLDSQDCDKIKNHPDVRDTLLRDVQLCTQSIANHFNSYTLFKLYGDCDTLGMPIKELKITPIWHSWTIIEQDVRLEIEKNGYCDVSHFMTTSAS